MCVCCLSIDYSQIICVCKSCYLLENRTDIVCVYVLCVCYLNIDYNQFKCVCKSCYLFENSTDDVCVCVSVCMYVCLLPKY